MADITISIVEKDIRVQREGQIKQKRTGVDIDADGGAGAVRVLRHDSDAVGQRRHAGLGAHKLGCGPGRLEYIWDER